MAITTDDVLSGDDIRATLEERTVTMRQFRRAFRDHDATGISSDSFTFPNWSGDLDDAMDEVAELAEYPRADLSVDGTPVSYSKYGFELEVSDEAVSDSRLELAFDRLETLGQAEEAKMDALAFDLLDANAGGPVSNAAGDYETVVDAYTGLVDAGYNPGAFELYLSPQAWGGLAKNEAFRQAMDADGDPLAINGQLGNIFGVPAVLTNTGDLGAAEGILVDTSKFGYESTRWPLSVEDYREESKDATVYHINARKGFAVTDAGAAVHIDFNAA